MSIETILCLLFVLEHINLNELFTADKRGLNERNVFIKESVRRSGFIDVFLSFHRVLTLVRVFTISP